MSALLTLLSAQGVLPDGYQLLDPLNFPFASADAPEQLIARVTPPDAPPPRA
jgi:hypothetical protein